VEEVGQTPPTFVAGAGGEGGGGGGRFAKALDQEASVLEGTGVLLQGVAPAGEGHREAVALERFLDPVAAEVAAGDDERGVGLLGLEAPGVGDQVAAVRVGGGGGGRQGREASRATTRWPWAARSRATRPSPQPTSRVRRPGAGRISSKKASRKYQ
jgi:hypothetical protein